MSRILCQCLLVTEDEVRRAVRGGAASLAQVSGSCEAGAACRSCHVAIVALLREEGERKSRPCGGQQALFPDE